MPETTHEPAEGDVLEHVNGEFYRFERVAPNGASAHVEQVRTGDRYDWTAGDIRHMIENGVLRRETEATVTDIDDLSEDARYRYEHAEPGDDSRTFRVELRWVDADDFADYGEGSVGMHYRDGYVADVPVSNVERMIEGHKIVRID